MVHFSFDVLFWISERPAKTMAIEGLVFSYGIDAERYARAKAGEQPCCCKPSFGFLDEDHGLEHSFSCSLVSLL